MVGTRPTRRRVTPWLGLVLAASILGALVISRPDTQVTTKRPDRPAGADAVEIPPYWNDSPRPRHAPDLAEALSAPPGEVASTLAAWFDAGGELPEPGCSLDEGGGTVRRQLGQVRQAAPALLAAGRGDVVRALAKQLMRGEFSSAMMGLSMLEEALGAGAASPDDLPPSAFVPATYYESACDDRVWHDIAGDVVLFPWSLWTSADDERAHLRAERSALLADMQALQDDPEALVRYLQDRRFGNQRPWWWIRSPAASHGAMTERFFLELSEHYVTELARVRAAM